VADDDRFRPRPGRPRAKGGDRIPRFTTKVLRAVSRAGPSAQAGLGRGRRTLRMGRGQVAAKVAGQALGPKSRRVVIKARLVNLKRAGPRSTSTHIRYLEREGVTRDGASGQAYCAMDDATDTRNFEERGREDRHQFRFIVSPEDAEDIGELRAFTRQLMEQMERDLGTKLEWIGVDHWDTDNPHTHIVLRGKDDGGKDLIIAPDYISRGMQARARELATEWLGLRTELEIRQSLTREVTQERWTSLDIQIARQADLGRISLATMLKREDYDRNLLVGRLRHLATMGLAERVSADSWTVAPNSEHTLRTLGERGDIIRTMQRSLGQARRELLIFDPKRSEPVVGRIADKGLIDELSDRTYVVLDGIDGRAHYARLASNVDIADLPAGGVVELRGVTEPRRVDRSIAELAIDGVYSMETARQRLEDASPAVRNPASIVDAQVRRLEVLRRGNVVERLDDGVWRVPRDLQETAMRYDQSRLSGVAPVVRSHLPVERQIRALGATWLDEQLTRDSTPRTPVGFGATVQRALDDRKLFLVEQGLAERRGQHIVIARNLLSTLRTKELESTGRRIESETGLVYRLTHDGDRVSGAYRRSLLLASGRFALVDDGVGFSLVPWRPVIESYLGRSVSAVVRGYTVSWDIGRSLSR
jgi:type IV secretory pathway VirD2 relaxase